MIAGRQPDPIYGQRAKQRSVHNNYFTLPVLFIMISNHYPMTYANANGWLVLGVLMVLALHPLVRGVWAVLVAEVLLCGGAINTPALLLRSGVGPRGVGYVLGIVKAYTTRVGEGPFACELNDEVGEHLAVVGREVGVNTYVRTDLPRDDAADEYWAATEDYWTQVRAFWDNLEATADTFHVADDAEGTLLYGPMLSASMRIAFGAADTAEAWEEAESLLASQVMIDGEPVSTEFIEMAAAE